MFWPARCGTGYATRKEGQAAALVEEGARRFEALGVVAVAQVVDAHLAILRWGVDEAPVADVDADMRKRAVERVEKTRSPGRSSSRWMVRLLRAMSAALPWTRRPAAWP
jgi:hypothetical protein